MKILLWIILVIFLIGLLVVTGVFKMIFEKRPLRWPINVLMQFSDINGLNRARDIR